MYRSLEFIPQLRQMLSFVNLPANEIGGFVLNAGQNVSYAPFLIHIIQHLEAWKQFTADMDFTKVYISSIVQEKYQKVYQKQKRALTLRIEATRRIGIENTLNGDELSALLEQFGGSAGGSAALTPDGNLSLIDDIGTTGGKQFITLQTKAGNTFYLIIDRDDEGEETVHFLNQVDEADLMALTEDGETAPATCTCTEKCEAGAVNTACPVCKDNLTACVGAAPEAEEPAETTEPEEEAGNSMGGLIVFLVVLLIGGGAALYFFKFKKPKADTKGNDDLDEYDFGEDEDDDEDEPAPEVEDDTGEVEARPLDDYLLDEDEPKKEDEV